MTYYSITKFLLIHIHELDQYTLDKIASECYVSLSCLKTFFRRYHFPTYNNFVKDVHVDLKNISYQYMKNINLQHEIIEYINKDYILIEDTYENAMKLVYLQPYCLINHTLLEFQYTNIDVIRKTSIS